jgi:hypothetical protein
MSRNTEEDKMLQVIGTTDQQDTCDCCGKTNLKMVVVLKDDDGEFCFYGRTCAARATSRRVARIDREVLAANAEADKARYLVERWSQYLTAEGCDTYRTRNPTSTWTNAEIIMNARTTVAVNRKRLAGIGA